MKIKWQEPPTPVRGKNRNWPGVVDELKKRPGEWALVAEDVAASTASYLKTLGAEATMRGVKNNRAAEMYARWPEGAEK